MPIFVCGISHKTAPVALREQVIFATDKLSLYLSDLVHNESIKQAVLLSTCNRSEIYCEADNVLPVIDWFCRQHAVPRTELESMLYTYEGQQAVQHIMSVACGLDSMVMGESQILGQMKEAFSESCIAGAIDTLFNRLFQQVFSLAKEVRTHTAIGACPVSISSAAIHMVKQYFSSHAENITKKTVVLMGAGDTANLLLRYLKGVNPARIIIVNRSIENAEKLAEQYSVEVFPHEELNAALKLADILLSATGSPHPIIKKDMLSSRQKPLFIVDVAVPRDIEESVSELPNISLHSIDDLKEIIQHNQQGREHAAEKAKEMIENKSKEFITWGRALEEVAITIKTYRQHVEDLSREELLKFKQLLQRGEDPNKILVDFAYSFTNKLLHYPTVQLRQAGVEGRFELLELVRELFTISKTKPELL